MSRPCLLHFNVVLLATSLFIQSIWAQNIFSSSVKNFERTITDLDIIHSSQGVPIDYRYNESTTSDTLTSVPGCPKSITGLPWIYYGNPKRCYLAQHKGPCGVGETLLAQNQSTYGICGCDFMALNPEEYGSLSKWKEGYISWQDNTGHDFAILYIDQVYDTKEQKCYKRYTRGPCKNENEVIASFTTDNIQCLPRCNIENINWYEMLTQGVCTHNLYSPSFVSYISDPEKNCKENYKYSRILNKCVRQFRFKF